MSVRVPQDRIPFHAKPEDLAPLRVMREEALVTAEPGTEAYAQRRRTQTVLVRDVLPDLLDQVEANAQRLPLLEQVVAAARQQLPAVEIMATAEDCACTLSYVDERVLLLCDFHKALKALDAWDAAAAESAEAR